MAELELLTETEAAAFLRLKKTALQQRRFYKKPPSYLNLDGTIRYLRADLLAYLASCKVNPDVNGAEAHAGA